MNRRIFRRLRLADEYPAVTAELEKGREGIAVAIVVLCVCRLSYAVVFLIAWLCTLPSYEGMALRHEVCLYIIMLRSVRKAELGHLLKDPYASCLSFLRNEVAECHVIVSYSEFDLNRLVLRVLECQDALCHIVGHLRSLASVH